MFPPWDGCWSGCVDALPMYGRSNSVLILTCILLKTQVCLCCLTQPFSCVEDRQLLKHLWFPNNFRISVKGIDAADFCSCGDVKSCRDPNLGLCVLLTRDTSASESLHQSFGFGCWLVFGFFVGFFFILNLYYVEFFSFYVFICFLH